MAGIQIILRNEATGKIKRFKITRSVILAFSMIIVGIITFTSYSIMCVFNDTQMKQEKQHLMAELGIKNCQLNYFAERMSQITGDLEKIRTLSQDIEYRLGREPQRIEEGIGGPSKGDYRKNPRSLIYQNNENALLNQMWDDIKNIEEETKVEKNRSVALSRFLQSRSDLIRSVPNQMPLSSCSISSEFGRRCDPISGALRMHTGLDMVNPNPIDVFATAEGVVTSSSYYSDYGNLVSIYHGFGISTHYAHLQEKLVEVGTWVEQGQRIGILGSTGRSTTRHLHYEVRIEGRPVNPRYFLPEDRLISENSGNS